LIALHLEGMGLDHPVLRRGVRGLEAFSVEDEGGWRFQACMSPVWDTAWAVLALRRAGVARSEPGLRRAVDWLLGEQISGGGDWQVKLRQGRWRRRARDLVRTGRLAPPEEIECGGWAFEFENDTYPDIDDTAVVASALMAAAAPGVADEAIHRALDWVLAMRSRNGAWAAFDRDNTRELVLRLPFADFGALLDPPSEDVTAHVLEMLAGLGRGARDPIGAGGVAHLRRTQRPEGSWFGRWGVNHVYGTWCVVSALTALKTGQDMVLRGVEWLLSVQNPDRGWGETCHSYVDETFAGRGASTASQTAWAVLTLQAAGLGEHPVCAAGLDFLRERQTSDGTWDEPAPTGTGFPGDFYINYHLYRHVFPTLALAGAR
jgi:squalene-hopene/tetraprenyl-beta-curcumene cyclase